MTQNDNYLLAVTVSFVNERRLANKIRFVCRIVNDILWRFSTIVFNYDANYLFSKKEI